MTESTEYQLAELVAMTRELGDVKAERDRLRDEIAAKDAEIADAKERCRQYIDFANKCGNERDRLLAEIERLHELLKVATYDGLFKPPPPNPIPRCDVCGWPLAASKELGCVLGDCSQRPPPITIAAGDTKTPNGDAR